MDTIPRGFTPACQQNNWEGEAITIIIKSGRWEESEDNSLSAGRRAPWVMCGEKTFLFLVWVMRWSVTTTRRCHLWRTPEVPDDCRPNDWTVPSLSLTTSESQGEGLGFEWLYKRERGRVGSQLTLQDTCTLTTQGWQVNVHSVIAVRWSEAAEWRIQDGGSARTNTRVQASYW